VSIDPRKTALMDLKVEIKEGKRPLFYHKKNIIKKRMAQYYFSGKTTVSAD